MKIFLHVPILKKKKKKTMWGYQHLDRGGVAMSVLSRRDFTEKGLGVGKHRLLEETAGQSYFLACG